MLRNRKTLSLLVLCLLAVGLGLRFWIGSPSSTASTVIQWNDVELQEAPLVQGQESHAQSAPRILVKDEGKEDRDSSMLSGIVQIRDGTRLLPASQARLYWVSADPNGKAPEVALEDMEYLTADEAGKFAGVVSSAGGLFCYVTHPFGVPIAVGLSRPTAGNRLVLEAASQISVQLLHAGAPAKGRFQVFVTPADLQSTNGRRAMTFKGRDGRCSCQGVPAKWKKARVQLLTRDERNLAVPRPIALRFARTEKVIVKYGGLVSLSGRVIDEAHAPVRDAKVYVYQTAPEKGATFRDASTTTDSLGHFLLEGLPAGSLRGSVSRSGYAYHGFIKSVSGSERGDLGDILLQKGFSISGEIDRHGRGEAWASRCRVGIMALDKSKSPKNKDLAPYASRWGSPSWSAGNQFRFDHLRPGFYRLAVIEGPLGNIRAAWTSVVVEVRSDVKGLVLSVPDGVIWRGRIRDKGTLPTEGVKVICRGIQGGWARFGKLDSTGEVEIRVPSVPFLLGVEIWTGPLYGLRWIGRVEQGVHEVKIPHGGIRLVMPTGGYDPPSYVRLVYLKTSDLGDSLGILYCGAPRVKSGMQTYGIRGLLPGSYRLDAFWFRHLQSYSFEVVGDKQVTSKWVFR